VTPALSASGKSISSSLRHPSPLVFTGMHDDRTRVTPALDQVAAAVRRSATESRRFLWILCKSCGHTSRLDPRYILKFLRTDISLKDTGRRFKCQRRNHRSAAIVIDDREPPGRD
jgi:hypothetical protein